LKCSKEYSFRDRREKCETSSRRRGRC